ncbi:N-acetylmuramoyl-L-alanine amidase [bacterium]|nr:N-acetylmuramoyl-L-alanine amidase [bacterium]MBU1983718.1 N-acetylmuramoyl-L-alanine amidase [bacterium]
MKRAAQLVLMLSLLVAISAQCAEIILVYPRTMGSEVFVYPNGLDSTFVLGRVEPPGSILRINGHEVVCTPRGAFLAWLPLCSAPDEKAWILSLSEDRTEIARVSFPYLFAADLPKTATSDTFSAISFPRVIEVAAPNAHTRTAIGGSYHIFPDSGCPLVALNHERDFYKFEIGGGLSGVIEDRFVTVMASRSLPEAVLGNGKCTTDGKFTLCTFSLSRAVPWSASLSSDQKSLNVMLFGTTAAIDRIRFDVADEFLTGITWEQLPAGLALSFLCKEPVARGYAVTCAHGDLRVQMRQPLSARPRSLRGKLIVLDPGHSGVSNGAIGPLGTREKDVNLRWANLLADELRRRGAIVELTRSADEDLDLYARIDFAKSRAADFFISLHCNALPDGVNPFVRHGTGTYYYQEASRRAAEKLHRRLVNASGLQDDGLWDANLAVVRPTEFPAVLLEAAYLIYPLEEELLQTDEFLRRLSKGVARGLKDYFREEP